MRTFNYTLAAFFIISAVFAQDVPDSVYERQGLEKLAALLNLKPADLRFRDDYTEKDHHRLATIAELMKNTRGMVEFTERLKDYCHEGSLNRILEFTFKNLEKEACERPRKMFFTPEEESDLAGINLFYNSLELNRLLLRARSFLYELFPQALDSTFHLLTDAQVEFLIHEFREIILEDTADVGKPVDILDSIQKTEEKYIKRFVEFSEKIRMDFLLAAGIVAATEIYKEISLIRDELESGRLTAQDILPDTVVTPERPGIASYLGKQEGWVIGGTDGDFYTGDYHFIIDFGGNDRYDLEYNPDDPHPVIIIDLSGNDIYNAVSDFVIGSGCLSFGLLFDMSGDDIYNGRNFSCGSGYFGLGLLYDAGGGDRYYGDTHTQGAASFGIGAIVDIGGSDLYSAALFGQGVGMTEGFGLVVDGGGNDNYAAGNKYTETYGLAGKNVHYLSLSQGFAYGFRPYTSGGIGATVDFGGNDTYVSDIYGQGSSYWWSLGVLFDDGGGDQYISYQYAQGAGIHMSLGLLLDQDGDDFYRGKGLMQGCGHDYGCGMIVDRHGNDIYKAYDLSQAAGSANGIGILIDDRGDDAYFVMRAQNTQGYGNPRRDFGSIGMFIDLEGEDRYVGNGADRSIWKTDSRWGGGMDIDFVPPDTTVETASGGSQAVEIPRVSNIEEKIDKLFVVASSGELKYRGMVEPAIDSIAAMGAAAVPRLVEKYDTKVARENHTINRILVKIAKEATPHLVESLTLDNPEQVSRICRSLGEIKDSTAVEGLMTVVANPDWRVRSNACSALGKIGDQRAGEAVAACLTDTVEVVRKSAAVACGDLLVEEAIPGLVHMLGDDFYGAALCASEALVKFGEKVIPVLADSLDSKNAMVGNLGCTTLGMIGGISAAAAVASQLTSESPVRRALAVEGILLSNSSAACGYVELINETEEDPTVRFYIEKVLEKYAP